MKIRPAAAGCGQSFQICSGLGSSPLDQGILRRGQDIPEMTKLNRGAYQEFDR